MMKYQWDCFFLGFSFFDNVQLGVVFN